MTEIELYKENIKEHGMMCDRFSASLETAKSNKQIADLALSVQAFDTLAQSIAQGWGISIDFINRRFKNFINGKYKSQQKGYTSRCYCCYYGDVYIDSTIVLLINCKVSLFLPANSICEIYCTGKCDINVMGSGRAVFICYGEPENIKITGRCGNMKRKNRE